MQLSLTVKGAGAETASYLLAKNPNSIYNRNDKGFNVRLVYPHFSENEMEVLIYVKPDPIELVRNSRDTYDITHYINDREFAVSSIFTSAIRTALGTALNGKPSEEYVQWVDHSFDLQLEFGPISTDLRDQELEALFTPMGYQVDIHRGNSKVREKSTAKFMKIEGKQTIQNALKHLYILIPVIDNYKHYFIDERELEKLDRYGEGWLQQHPLRMLILKRALRFQDVIKLSKFYQKDNQTDERKEKPEFRRLNDLRYEAIVNTIRTLPRKEAIVDLGAGEGKLSVQLGFLEGVKEILSVEPLNQARRKALDRFEQASGSKGFIHPTSLMGSLFYFDKRLQNKDVMVLCEVIEHIDESRLPKVFDTILKDYRPRVLIVTTPNQEYNAVYEMEDTMRHNDHRFEWTRVEFQERCLQWAKDFSYDVTLEGIGDRHETLGHPTQMAIFRREEK